ncbi:GNAT family N-acetyltransferase [Albimonas pacifica]|uniref:L-amino acid N-acyltransferase YncA n=1 Tax=Albimonas pacifica TaxID=1114924 RepID=A0A1I3LRV0_9RHOB|nr:GNAT family N-acetyltransferase [Albimonas pacifica]SFI87423.1 L-amino acid N-acyltransferase YncA [Albimonas pacifica]
MAIALRLATEADRPALTELMRRAIDALQTDFLTAEQVAASHAIMGMDPELIADGTYFVAEEDGAPLGCGGWSRRRTLFGGDHTAGRDSGLLDPAAEPARVRAMYTDPAAARRGVGRLILAAAESAAAAEGFRRGELVATLSGAPLYRACGWEVIERFEAETPGGVPVPVIRMGKALS